MRCSSVVETASAPTMRTLLRASTVWLVIILVEVAHGIARTLLLAPVVGDFHARQIAVFSGSALILTVSMMFIRWLRPARLADAVAIGIVWLGLTLAFELAFGRYVVQAPWSRIAEDYNLAHGGLLPLGLLVLALAPLIAARCRRVL